MICELVASFYQTCYKVIHLSVLTFHHYYPISLYYEEMFVFAFNCFEQCICPNLLIDKIKLLQKE